MYDYLTQTLIDTRATHSFISCTLARTLELPIDVLINPFRVTMPVRRNVILNLVV